MSTAEYRFRVDPGEQPEWIDRSIVQSRRSNALRARLCCFLLCIPPVSHCRIYIIVREYVSGYFDQLFDKWVLPNIRKLNFFFLFENYRIL